MKSLLFAVFADRSAAQRARALLAAQGAPGARTSRLHEGELDLMLGVDLADTLAQDDCERSVGWRFGLAFLACAGLGLAVDLSGLLGDTGLSATMALGSLGILLGTLFVLTTARQPLDRALVELDSELARGGVVLSVPIDTADSVAAAEAIRTGGGRVVFEA